MDREPSPQKTAGLLALIIFGTFGFVFAGIGLTVLVGMWIAPFGEFHSPPLFFRIVATFISLAFIAMGGAMFFAAMTGQIGMRPSATRESPASSVGYSCPKCGATLNERTDVSPLGDVKCPFCNQWFNIHRRAQA